MRLLPGTSLGPYVIGEPLGAGGMGEVYRARDPRLGRDVAVKVVAGATDSDRIARFEREARATAVLAHPNILTVFDVGTHEGLPFLVTELLDGMTLRARIDAGRLDPGEAVRIALQVARGMAAAHALRIIHRDIKPDNLFLVRDGSVKILDFGLAKLRKEFLFEAEGPTRDASQPGLLLGTPAYMAPEQARGEPVDERADLFSLGAVLYEMVSGRSPFRKPSVAESLAAILHETPPALGPREQLPAAVDRVIAHCLEKDAGDRCPSAAELVRQLESLQNELSQAPPAGAGAAERRAASSTATPTPGGTRPPASIAVLPFADMSATRDQDYLCEGIAEELINALTHIDGLRVAARSSSFQFRASAGVDIQAIGARLGVGSVLEGGVRKAGDRLRVTVRLVDVADGYQRWSARYDRGLEDVFAVQDEISESVATALRGLLSQQEKEALRRPEAAVEAYEYYLRGRKLINALGTASIVASTKMFERAIELDPDYALAHAGLAEGHAWLYEWLGGGADSYAKADRASRTALELAPSLAEAHTARGFVLSLSRHYEDAQREFLEAIRLSPNLFEAHYLYARMLFAWGRPDRAADLYRRASEVRPEDFQSRVLLALSLRVIGRNEEATEANREGVRRAERLLELNPTDARALSLGANALHEDGRSEQALTWSRRAIELYPQDGGVLINGACLRAQLGLKEEALDLLERVFGQGFGKRDWIEKDPDYAPLRDDPRFQALLAKLK